MILLAWFIDSTENAADEGAYLPAIACQVLIGLRTQIAYTEDSIEIPTTNKAPSLARLKAQAPYNPLI